MKSQTFLQQSCQKSNKNVMYSDTVIPELLKVSISWKLCVVSKSDCVREAWNKMEESEHAKLAILPHELITYASNFLYISSYNSFKWIYGWISSIFIQMNVPKENVTYLIVFLNVLWFSLTETIKGGGITYSLPFPRRIMICLNYEFLNQLVEWPLLYSLMYKWDI